MNKFFVCFFVLSAICPPVLADNKKISSRDYTIGKPTQNVKPREIKETIRPDGKRSIVAGQNRNENGKIVGPHSHSVTKDGRVIYSRTAGGKVVKDEKK